MSDLATRMRKLAATLSAGWELEQAPTSQYLHYAQAFREAARRINVEVDAHEKENGLPHREGWGSLNT